MVREHGERTGRERRMSQGCGEGPRIERPHRRGRLGQERQRGRAGVRGTGEWRRRDSKPGRRSLIGRSSTRVLSRLVGDASAGAGRRLVPAGTN